MTTDLVYRPASPIGQRLLTRTPVGTYRSGRETRRALNTHPRWQLEYQIHLPTEADARRIEWLLEHRMGETWRAPVWFERFELDEAVEAPANTLFGDFALADWAAGDLIYLAHPDGETGEFHTLDAVDTNSVDIVGVLASAYPAGTEVMLALSFFLGDGQDLTRLKVDGAVLSVTLDIERHRSAGGVGQGIDVTTYRGLPVLDRLPIGERFVDARSWGGDRIDFGSRVQQVRGYDRIKKASARRFYLGDRAELQWFRQLVGSVYGMRDPFWAPTWRPDFAWAAGGAAGATTVDVEDDPAGLVAEWFAAERSPHIQARSAAGAVSYHRVTAVADLGATARLTLNYPLPFDVSDGTLSFLQLVRVGRDEVVISHHDQEAFGDLVVKTLDEALAEIEASGIASAEAFGNARLDGHVNPSGIASAEAFGTPEVGGYVNPSGIASAEAFGTASVEGVVAEIEPSGIPSAEAFGTASVDGTIRIITDLGGDPPVQGGIPSAEAFGSANVGGSVHASGIASAEAFGSAGLFHTEGGYYLPETVEESTAVGGTLDHIWLMQSAASPVEDEQTAATDFDLTVNGTLDFQQTRTGWSRYFITITETLNERLIIGNAVNVTTTSFVLLFLAEFGAMTVGTRTVTFGATGNLLVQGLATGVLRLNVDGTLYDGTYVYESDAEAHMLSFEGDQRGGKDTRLRSNEETIEGAWDVDIGNAVNKSWGATASGVTATAMHLGWAGLAKGANAEALIDAVGGPIAVYTV